MGHYFDLITAAIAKLSPDGLLNQLIARDEALLHEEEISQETLPSRIACFGESSQLAQDLTRDHNQRVEAAVASRFLVEYVAASPPSGQDALTLEAYDHLLGLAAELTARATLSDAIHHGFSESQLAILESGRLGVSRGDRYEAGTKAIAAAMGESRRRMALEPPLTTSSAQAAEPGPDIEEAAQAEFGFTITDLAHGVGELIALGDERCTEEPYALRLQEVDEHLRSSLGWSQEQSRAFIDRLSLRPRANFLSVGFDAYPWRYNREWSYARRPLVQVERLGGDPVLMWGARRLWSTGSYWLGLIYSGRLRAESKPMKMLLGTIRQGHNKDFESLVEAALRAGGCTVTANGVSKIAGGKLLSRDGHDLGDIDALGVNAASKLIVVAEAKDFEVARNPAELANEADALLRGDKSALHKLSRRAQWVRDHLASTLSHLGVNDGSERWAVAPVIVTSRDLISPRVLPSDIQVVPLEMLEGWVSRELARTRRSARRRRR